MSTASVLARSCYLGSQHSHNFFSGVRQSGRERKHSLLLDLLQEACWKRSCGLQRVVSSIIPARPQTLSPRTSRGDGANVTCPAKTSKVSAEAASLSCRLLGVSLWCFPTLARRCQCCCQRRPSGRSGRPCPSVGPSDPQEPPLQQAKKLILRYAPPGENLLNKDTRFGFISTYRNTAAFRLPTGDVSASLGRNVTVGPFQRAEGKQAPHFDSFFGYRSVIWV